MSLLKSSGIYYLDKNEIREASDVRIKSSVGEVHLNRLFLASFSPLLKSLFNKIDENIVIVTNYDHYEIEVLNRFCTEGILPMDIDDLAREIPCDISKLFHSFGIDLGKILFQKKSSFKAEDLNEEDFISELLKHSDKVKLEPLAEISDEDNGEEIIEESDDDVKPSKKRKLNQNSSQVQNKFNNYMQIQEKYKNHLRVTIPNIEEPDRVKFANYVPVQPLESFWKPPRPPSRKKKKPKGYDKYPLGCKQCPKRFTSEILQAFHVKVYHNPHFQCPYCPNAYHQDEQNKFKKHLFNHEHVTKTATPHECIQCGKQDFCLQRLIKHIDNFRGPFHNNQCTQCHETFQSYQQYASHVDKLHFGVWKFRCDDCENVFETLQAAKEHRLEAHKRKQPPKHTVQTMCDICGKVLKGSSIPNHMKIVHMTEQPDTPCPHCGKVVKELQRHIKRSHEKLPCDLCGKLVPPGHMLRHNDQYHTAPEERRYKCEVCNKGFSTKQRLTDHVHTHTGERPYTCHFCGKGFANSSGCRLHVRFTHLGQKRMRKK